MHVDHTDQGRHGGLRPWQRRSVSVAAAVALGAGGLLGLSSPAGADAAPPPATIYVNGVAGAGYDSITCGAVTNQCATIQQGIDNADPGDIVKVAAATYNETVTITKPITLQGAGSATTIIDGTGATFPGPSPTFGGLITIKNPGGDVTVDGFTLQNPIASDQNSPFDVSLGDTTAGDTATFTNNVFAGNPTDPDITTDGQIGIATADNAAAVTITDNEFYGTFQGVLLEGQAGASTVTGNHFHDLTTFLDTSTGTTYPGEGVYVLSDKETPSTDQTITGNDFRDYGGIGIAISAGYDFGGCAPVSCDGTVTSTVTGNTFDLGADDAQATASAIRLRALNASDTLAVTLGDNSGTVTAPTLPIQETPGDGTITITPTDTPNTIVPTPTPTLSVNTPTKVTTLEDPEAFTGTATNPAGGDTLNNSRYDVAITGASGISADQIDLKYEESGTFYSVPLTGTTASGGTITGYFGAIGGFTFPANVTAVTNFTLAVTDDAPAGDLTTTVSLDQVSSGTGNPAIDTLATTSNSTTVVVNSKPSTPDIPLSTPFNTPLQVTLPSTDADGDTIAYAHGFAGAGDVTGSGPNLTYTPTDGFAGTDSFTYTENDGKAGMSTGTVTITVAKAPTTISVAARTTPITAVTAHSNVYVYVTSAGSSANGTVTITNNGVTLGSATVVNGRAVVPIGKQAAGTYNWVASYSGTGNTAPASKTFSVTVVKVATTIGFATSPAKITTATAKSNAYVFITSTGATTAGAKVTITNGSKTVGSATVASGKAIVPVGKLAAGTYNWLISYAGTSTSAPATRPVTVTVTKA